MKIQVQYGRLEESTVEAYVRVFLEDPARQVGYAYRIDEPVSVGDVVLVPGTWLNPHPQEATVVALGSEYAGPTASVVQVLERKGGRSS